jgi:hypothetical protein
MSSPWTMQGCLSPLMPTPGFRWIGMALPMWCHSSFVETNKKKKKNKVSLDWNLLKAFGREIFRILLNFESGG